MNYNFTFNVGKIHMQYTLQIHTGFCLAINASDRKLTLIKYRIVNS